MSEVNKKAAARAGGLHVSGRVIGEGFVGAVQADNVKANHGIGERTLDGECAMLQSSG